MTTLITGGTGKTGSALAKLLHDANHPLIIGSRAGKAPAPYKAVEFDFLKAETYENPFAADANIDRVYLLAPPGKYEALPHVNAFIDFAISKGVKRFVYLSASQVGPERVPAGAIHRHLIDVGIDYTVLRSTWFIPDGRLPWVSAEDIAQAAFDSLTAEKSPNKDIFMLGPELLSHDEAAKLLSSVLGREITHKRYTLEEMTNTYSKIGLDTYFSKSLSGMQDAACAAKGNEEALFNGPAESKYIAKHTLLEFFEANKDIWIK